MLGDVESSADEPTHDILSDVVGEFQRIGIAATKDDVPTHRSAARPIAFAKSIVLSEITLLLESNSRAHRQVVIGDLQIGISLFMASIPWLRHRAGAEAQDSAKHHSEF